MNKYDVLLDEGLDLREDPATHDLVEGESTLQHQELLLICPKGSFKENPDTGVGLMNYLEDENDAEMFAEIRRQFSADFMQVKAVGMNNGKLNIDATYTQ